MQGNEGPVLGAGAGGGGGGTLRVREAPWGRTAGPGELPAEAGRGPGRGPGRRLWFRAARRHGLAVAAEEVRCLPQDSGRLSGQDVRGRAW